MPGPWDAPQDDQHPQSLGDALDELERAHPIGETRDLTAGDISLFLLWVAIVVTPFWVVWLVHHGR